MRMQGVLAFSRLLMGGLPLTMGVTGWSLGGAHAEVAASPDFTIDEILVTAQRREQRMQDVPVSIVAYSGAAIEKARLTDMQEVVAISPNIVLGNESTSNMHIFIRGIGTQLPDGGAQQSVGFYVDDVFVTRAGGLTQDMFDVERIEVLRGPQGTLYGKNVIGGVVNVINNKPDFNERSAIVSVGGGSYDLIETKGMINIPLTEKLAFRGTASYRERDGYIDNIFEPAPAGMVNPDPFNGGEQCADCTGDMDDVESIGVRLQLAGEASEKLSWSLSGFYNSLESDGVHIKPTNVISGFFKDIGYVEPAGTHDVLNGNIQGGLDSEFSLGIFRLNYASDNIDITSISSYQVVNYEEVRDVVNLAPVFSFSPLSLVGGAGFRSEPNVDEKAKVFSQELRIASQDGGSYTMNDKLTWIAGLYYSQENIERSQFRPRRLTVATFGPPPGAVSAPLWEEDVKRTTVAGFGQITYALTDQLNFTAGLRWTYDKIDFETEVSDPLGFASIPGGSLNPATELFGPTDSSESWKEFSGTAGLDYHLTDDVMVYALYSRGFKGGGFQGTAPNLASATKPFEPEFADNYEIGIKSYLFDKSLMFNFSAFYIDFQDLQLIERVELTPGDPTTGVLTVFNAASAKIKGFEAEAMWMPPVDGLRFSVAGGVLDTNVGESLNPLNVDTDLPQAPGFSATVAADYNYSVSDNAALDFRVAYRYTGAFWWDLANKEPGREKGYGLLDASIGLTHKDWSLTLWGKNLTNKGYRSYAQSILQDVVGGVATNRGGAAVSRIGDPRTLGITLRKDFSW